ncbi:MAG: competence protein ComEC [Idiomarinaceae bacterium HL-53]|nr:MAG: competence protein ComEC [Idiomarinaceae bacterium HL-53]CUS49312.1 competence protein ComEC [Idiomarinaceae bacterium HL-53]
MSQQTFTPWAMGAILGILSSPLLPVLTLAALGISTCVLLLCVLSFIIARKQRIRWTRGTLLLGGVLCGIWWTLFNLSTTFSWQLNNEVWRQPAEVIVKVTEFSTVSSFRTRVTGCILTAPDSWQLPRQECAVKFRAAIYELKHEVPQVGEIWRFQARFKPSAGTLNGFGFDYQKYLNRHRLRLVGALSEGERLQRTPHWHIGSLQNQVFSALEKFRPILKQEGILLALGLGERQWLSHDDWQILQRTGLAHIIAISGLHLALVFSGFLWIIERVTRTKNWLTVLLAFAAAVFYAAIAGFSITTVRALVLIAVFCLLRLLGVRKPAHYAWLVAVLIIFWIDPLAWMDTGFWLSAGAVLAIFTWYWRYRPRASGHWYDSVALLWRFEFMLLLTLTPLSILYFGGIAWLAPLTNLLVVPLFSFLLLPLTLLSMLLSVIWLPGALLLWQGLDIVFTALMIGLAGIAEWHFSWLEVHHVGWALVCFTLLLILNIPASLTWRFSATLLACFAFMLVALNTPRVTFAVHHLDVGQGAALVLQQGRRAVLIDTGPSFESGFNAGQQIIIPFLQKLELQPDWGIITHQHQDHRGGQAAIWEAFPHMQWLGNSQQEQSCYFGQQWLWEEVRIRVLAPLPGPRYGENNSSCVLLIEFREQRILLPGDSEDINELRLVGRYRSLLNADVLSVSHHGSQRSSVPEFLNAVSPRIAVVSRGFANQFGMPNEEVKNRYQDRNIEFYDTGRQGRVSLFYDTEQPGDWRVELQRVPNRTPWFHALPEER